MAHRPLDNVEHSLMISISIIMLITIIIIIIMSIGITIIRIIINVVIMPWHFGEDKSRLRGVPKKSLCQKTQKSQ